MTDLTLHLLVRKRKINKNLLLRGEATGGGTETDGAAVPHEAGEEAAGGGVAEAERVRAPASAAAVAPGLDGGFSRPTMAP